MNANTITIGEARLSYVHVFEPYAATPGQEPKYTATILIPKANAAAKRQIDEAIEAAKQQGIQNRWNGQAPAMLATTLHDGDGFKQNGEAYGPECKGHWVLNCNANTNHPPKVVNLARQPIIDQSEVYSGCYGKFSVTFYGYNSNGNRGIAAGLGNIQKLKDGESLGGRTTAAEDFETEEDEDFLQ